MTDYKLVVVGGKLKCLTKLFNNGMYEVTAHHETAVNSYLSFY